MSINPLQIEGVWEITLVNGEVYRTLERPRDVHGAYVVNCWDEGQPQNVCFVVAQHILHWKRI